MIGNIIDPRVSAEVGDAFGGASARVRHRLARSRVREDQGQASTREDTFTDDLVEDMEIGIAERIDRTCTNLSTHSTGVRVQFAATKAPQGEENRFGLDLGLRVSIEAPGYTIEKAILVQCKRMYGASGSGTFPKLRGDGEKQAEDMLNVTPASFFFLFNGGTRGELWELMRPHGFQTWTWQWLRPELGPFDDYFDPGIVVMPAARVLALSRGSSTFPIKAKDVLPGTIPLGQFIAELFAPCIVGDPRKQITQLATPPSLRDSVDGVDAGAIPVANLEARRFHHLKITKPASGGA